MVLQKVQATTILQRVIMAIRKASSRLGVLPSFLPTSLHDLLHATCDGFSFQVLLFLFVGLSIVHFMFLGVVFCLDFNDAPPKSLKDSNINPKVKTLEEERIGICSLACNTSRLKEACQNSRMGIKMTSRSIIHIDLHKLNNKLVSAWLEHFWCTNEPQTYTNS